MSFENSVSGLLEFLDWMADKGLAPSNTISARKASANKVITSLGEEEAANVLDIDVEDAIQRFATKHGQQYSTDSLRSYKSRLKTALDDFRGYKADPVGFRPAGRTPSVGKSDKKASSNTSARRKPIPAPTSSPPTPSANSGNVVPVPIREDVIVKIGNLPFDLSADEAKKIANVILAYGGAL